MAAIAVSSVVDKGIVAVMSKSFSLWWLTFELNCPRRQVL
jgi:hypothetical protein